MTTVSEEVVRNANDMNDDMILFYFTSLVTSVMHLRSFSSGGTTKIFNL